MTTILRHAIVLLITDDRDGEAEAELALSTLGCIVHRAEPGARFDGHNRYDAAVLMARQNASWYRPLVARLRSHDCACASLMVLGTGGPEAVGEALQRGAADCLVRPVSEPELIESLAAVIEASRRWRARFSRARLTAGTELQVAAIAAARVFEPVEQGTMATVPRDDEQAKIEGIIDRLGAQKSLTRREREVFFWLLLGHRYEDIASVLGIRQRTAKFHAANLLEKLGLESRYDLARLLADELEL